MTIHTPHKRVPGSGWQAPAKASSHPEGTITTSVRGNQVNITVKLRRTWAVLMYGADLHGDNRQEYLNLRRMWNFFDSGIKVAVCAAVLFFGYEIGSAFLPGGAANRVITGGK